MPGSTSLPSPSIDPSPLWNLGVTGVPIVQYLRWADDADVFVALADAEIIGLEEFESRTTLNSRSAEAMLGVLCGLALVERTPVGLTLDGVARVYLDRRSPFYVGPALYGMLHSPIPARLTKGRRARRFSEETESLRECGRYRRRRNNGARPQRPRVQHSRTSPAAATAARTRHFNGIRHLVDVGGGSGAFAIPLALDRPDIRITLIELPRSVPHIRPFLDRYGVQHRVRIVGANIHRLPWPIDHADAVLLANMMHFCADDECLVLLRESHRLLGTGGKILIHEMLWDDCRTGPMVTALWNFWIMSVSAGRQRTRDELAQLLELAGFARPDIEPTTGGFSLLVSAKAASR
jgi:SAM-dependent methyltransferase